MMRIFILFSLGLILLCSVCAATDAQYVWVKVCATCHKTQLNQWQGSHHDLAMKHATPSTVLADFNDTSFTYFDITSTFFKKDKKYFVTTDGPNGELETYEIKYTFGVYPLQQYLVEFPNGHYQSLSIAWDSRSIEEDGQRWFHLYPDDQIKHGSSLHWTGLDQNWNYMCAECHSTNLMKNFDLSNDQFQTTWSDINVSCEACHGPGAEHVNWASTEKTDNQIANNGLVVDLRNSAAWIINQKTGLASRSLPKDSDVEIEICARCHSRRSAQWEDYVHGKPLLDTHIPATLNEGLYFADGQINDEVYVYGSFLQSKMYMHGVTCSDCHNPHTLDLKIEGNELCSTCHLATIFDTPTPHHHDDKGAGSKCVACHMPEKDFMIIDARADHSFRIPRPELSEALGVPNACTTCHEKESNTWAAAAIEKWYPNSGKRNKTHFGEMLHAGRSGSFDANQQLIELASNNDQPSIARATATTLLQNYINPYSITAINEMLHDENVLVRISAINSVEFLPADVKNKLLQHLLVDDLRMVRMVAARVLADSQDQFSDESLKNHFNHAIDEYIGAQNVNADRPEAHVNLGSLYMATQRMDQAQMEYETAIKIDANFIPAYINLADLYRARGLDAKGKQYILTAIKKRNDDGLTHHSLGLLYVRENNLHEALASFQKAVEVDSGNTRFKYVYAVALESAGEGDRAIEVLKQAHEQTPADRDVLYALISYNQKVGSIEAAKHYAKILVQVAPWDQNAQTILNQF